MIIELPKKFYKADEYGNYAQVEDGRLEIHGQIDFEKLMIELTYQMKGRCRCFYCRRKVKGNKITIDHLFPVDFGGMSIPNNLEPACSWCNSRKSNMNQYEFRVWSTLSTDEARRSFYHATIAKKHKRKFSKKTKKGFDLPKSWVEMRRLDDIQKTSKMTNRDSKKFYRMQTFVRRYGKLPRTIVISANGYVLDGLTAYEVARKLQLEEVPVTVLENVFAYRRK